MKVLKETQKYALVKVPEKVCREGKGTLVDSVVPMMEYYEELETKGLIPLDYVRNIEAILCKKTDDYLG